MFNFNKMGRSTAEAYIKHLYETILYREPDPGGFEDWVNEAMKFTESQRDLGTIRQNFVNNSAREIEGRMKEGTWPGYERKVAVKSEINAGGEEEKRTVNVIKTPEEEQEELNREIRKRKALLMLENEKFAHEYDRRVNESKREIQRLNEETRKMKEEEETKKNQAFSAKRKRGASGYGRTGRTGGAPWDTILSSFLGGSGGAKKKSLIGM